MQWIILFLSLFVEMVRIRPYGREIQFTRRSVWTPTLNVALRIITNKIQTLEADLATLTAVLQIIQVWIKYPQTARLKFSDCSGLFGSKKSVFF